jgi:hypothetical protein
MCELTFRPSDVARWARFSGDYNPIHFDPERARRLGAGGVIAHGMLVLLAVKGRAAAALPPGGGWWLLRGRLRHPVLAGEPVRLETRRQGEGVAFTLASADGRKLLTGALARLGGAPAPAAAGSSSRLGPEALAARVRELNEAFPWPAEPWVAADALVFAEFLRGGAREVLAPHGIDLAHGADGGKVVVQTAHEVAFDRDFLGGAGPRAAGLDIDVLPPQAEAVEGGVFATCQLVSRCDGRVVMLTSVGLFIRQAPAGASPKE